MRRPWPDDIVMSPEVKKKIDEIWAKLGIAAT
jgi:3-polyprenyl-4-hydroxybenzoate decarboxylase